MKLVHNNPEKIIWDSTRCQSGATIASSQSRALPKLMVWLILFVSASYFVYTMKLLSSSPNNCDVDIFSNQHFYLMEKEKENPTKSQLPFRQNYPDERIEKNKTGLQHIVFGIAASAKLWGKRKEYIKLWWKPELRMRGIVWLDNPVKVNQNENVSLPELRISGDTSRFAYKNRKGHRSAIRISRIVSETLRMGGMDDIRWFVMGDDDTVFVTDNLVRILNKYDHNQYYYIGSSSESHLQNIHFSYGMAYGGGGFAISYPLAKALEKMQDRCIQRYPGLYGSDDRMQACMSELGVPLTKELGFHQVSCWFGS